MAVVLTINGSSYDYPQTGDTGWGAEATDWATAVTNGMLQKAGGLFQLLADVDFGTVYGVKAIYYKSRDANPADSGVIRLGNGEFVAWRNTTHNTNFGLTCGSTNRLEYGGVIVPTVSSSDVLTGKSMDGLTNTFTNLPGTGITGIVPVANGGTGLASGTSGGILAYTASGTLASSAALTASQLIIGGGAGVVPSTLAAGSQYQVLRMGATTPAYGSINLDQTAAVTGTLPVTNGGMGAATFTVNGVLLGNTTSAIKVTAAGSANTVFRVPGGGGEPAFGSILLTAGSAAITGTLGLANGGLGLTTGTSGGILAFTAAGTLASSGALTANQLVIGGGAGVAPSSLAAGTVSHVLVMGAANPGYALLLNANIDAAAAIAVSKLAALTVSRAVVTDASGFISAATTTSTQIGYLSTTTSDVQTQINLKASLAGTTPFSATQTISKNVTTLPSPISGTMLHLGDIDGNNSRITIDAFAASNGGVAGRRANTSAASPSNLVNNDVINQLAAFGYGTTGYSAASRASVTLAAAETWSDSAQGTKTNFTTTALTTTTTATSLTLASAGHTFGLTGAAHVINGTMSFNTSEATQAVNGIRRSTTNTLAISTNSIDRITIDTAAVAHSLPCTTTAIDVTANFSGLNAAATASSTKRIYDAQYTVDTDCTGGYFFNCMNSSGTTIGRIEAASNTTVNFTGTSDERLKTDAGEFTALPLIMEMKPRNYEWKSNPGENHLGFFAQELHKVLPGAVSVGDDTTNDDGTLKNPWGVDYGRVTPVLVKAIQELQAQIETLKAKLNEKENK